ncbi:MAG: helix-turn-helix domain-containing protein [Hadesarchaea archaeon]|nr:helix-turn-helix domain-containing protein [Hadesarchaea archaeon]
MKQLSKRELAVLAYFFENPRGEVYLRELARRSRMSPATVLRATNLLVKRGLLLKRAERNATYFGANLTPEFKEMKKAYTVSKIFDAGAVDLIKERSAGLASISLYGSAAKGEDDPGSDYDFLVIASKCAVKPSELSEKLGREATLQVYDAAGWKRVSKQNRAFYLDVISSSVSLYGEKPVID